jgi:hypothetical protein
MTPNIEALTRSCIPFPIIGLKFSAKTALKDAATSPISSLNDPPEQARYYFWDHTQTNIYGLMVNG